MKKTIKKPTGEIGGFKFYGPKDEYIKIDLPEKKEDIENLIVHHFVSLVDDQKYDFPEIKEGPIQNKENDFDFVFKTEKGNEYLELMEVAPLNELKSTHDNALDAFNQYDFASSIWNLILKKSQHYRFQTDLKIHLLLYPTNYKFALSPSLNKFLQGRSHKERHIFSTIFYFSFLMPGDGIILPIFPVKNNELNHFSEESLKNKTELKLTNIFKEIHKKE